MAKDTQRWQVTDRNGRRRDQELTREIEFSESEVAGLVDAGWRFGRRLNVYRAQSGRVTNRQSRRAKHKLNRDDRRAVGRKF